MKNQAKASYLAEKEEETQKEKELTKQIERKLQLTSKKLLLSDIMYVQTAQSMHFQQLKAAKTPILLVDQVYDTFGTMLAKLREYHQETSQFCRHSLRLNPLHQEEQDSDSEWLEQTEMGTQSTADTMLNSESNQQGQSHSSYLISQSLSRVINCISAEMDSLQQQVLSGKNASNFNHQYWQVIGKSSSDKSVKSNSCTSNLAYSRTKKKILTFEILLDDLDSLDAKQICQLVFLESKQLEICNQFFDQEVVFREIYDREYGSNIVPTYWQICKQNWLDIMQSIHTYFFKPLYSNRMRFHFMRTFEFFLTRLIYSHKPLDFEQYFKKWLYLLTPDQLNFLHVFGYALVLKYNKVYKKCSVSFVFNTKVLNISQILKKNGCQSVTGRQYLRSLLIEIEKFFTNTRPMKTYQKSLKKLQAKRHKVLFNWYDADKDEKEQFDDVMPFEGTLREHQWLNGYEQLEKEFSKTYFNRFVAQTNKADQMIKEFLSDQANKNTTSNFTQNQLEDEVEKIYQTCLSGIPIIAFDTSSQYQAPTEEEWQDQIFDGRRLILLTLAQKAVLDQLVSACLNQEEDDNDEGDAKLICFNGFIVEASTKTKLSKSDLNRLQLKMHFMSHKDLSIQVDDSYANKSKQFEEYLEERRKCAFQVRKESWEDYIDLLKCLWRFLWTNPNLSDIFYSQIPGGREDANLNFTRCILAHIIKQYFVDKNKRVLCKVNILRRALRRLQFEKMKIFREDYPDLWQKMCLLQEVEYTALRSVMSVSSYTTAKDNYCYYQYQQIEDFELNQRLQNKRYKALEELEGSLILQPAELEVLQLNGLMYSPEEQLCDADLLTLFKQHLESTYLEDDVKGTDTIVEGQQQKQHHKNSKEYERFTRVLGHCLNDSGVIAELFSRDLKAYRGFCLDYSSINRIKRQLDSQKQYSSYHIPHKKRRVKKIQQAGFLSEELAQTYDLPLKVPDYYYRAQQQQHQDCIQQQQNGKIDNNDYIIKLLETKALMTANQQQQEHVNRKRRCPFEVNAEAESLKATLHELEITLSKTRDAATQLFKQKLEIEVSNGICDKDGDYIYTKQELSRCLSHNLDKLSLKEMADSAFQQIPESDKSSYTQLTSQLDQVVQQYYSIQLEFNSLSSRYAKVRALQFKSEIIQQIIPDATTGAVTLISPIVQQTSSEDEALMQQNSISNNNTIATKLLQEALQEQCTSQLPYHKLTSPDARQRRAAVIQLLQLIDSKRWASENNNNTSNSKDPLSWQKQVVRTRLHDYKSSVIDSSADAWLGGVSFKVGNQGLVDSLSSSTVYIIDKKTSNTHIHVTNDSDDHENRGSFTKNKQKNQQLQQAEKKQPIKKKVCQPKRKIKN